MSPSPITPPIVRGSLAGWLAGGAQDAPCHGICARFVREGNCDPIPDRPVSWDGIRLCVRFCRGFAARRNTIVVHRNARTQIVRRPRRRAATESAP